MHTQHLSGFTLLETLIVLSITSIVIALAIPQFHTYTKHMTLRNEALKIRLFLESCAAYAIASRSTIEVLVSMTKLTAVQQGGDTLKQHVVRNGAELTLLNPPEIPLLFHPTITASPKTLTLKKIDMICSVIVSLRGRIRIAC